MPRVSLQRPSSAAEWAPRASLPMGTPRAPPTTSFTSHTKKNSFISPLSTHLSGSTSSKKVLLNAGIALAQGHAPLVEKLEQEKLSKAKGAASEMRTSTVNQMMIAMNRRDVNELAWSSKVLPDSEGVMAVRRAAEIEAAKPVEEIVPSLDLILGEVSDGDVEESEPEPESEEELVDALLLLDAPVLTKRSSMALRYPDSPVNSSPVGGRKCSVVTLGRKCSIASTVDMPVRPTRSSILRCSVVNLYMHGNSSSSHLGAGGLDTIEGSFTKSHGGSFSQPPPVVAAPRWAHWFEGQVREAISPKALNYSLITH